MISDLKPDFFWKLNEGRGHIVSDAVSRRNFVFDPTYTPDWNIAQGIQGVEFNANREHINGPPLSSILPAGTDGTIIFKFKYTTNPPSGYHYYFMVGESDYTVFALLSPHNVAETHIHFNGFYAVPTHPGVYLHNFTIIGVTWHETGGYVYVSVYGDGQLLGTGNTSQDGQGQGATVPNTTDLFNFGSRVYADDRFAGGIVDWLYIKQRELSAREMAMMAEYEYVEEIPIWMFDYTAGGGYSIPVISKNDIHSSIFGGQVI